METFENKGSAEGDDSSPPKNKNVLRVTLFE
jgi:hypothetical protein